MEENNMQQVESITAAAVDERIAGALEQVRAEWERAQAENQRVAAMSQEERAGYVLSLREAELAEREKKLLARELKAMALEKLAARGLPAGLADALSYESEEACLKGIDSIERAFRDAVQAAVDKRLRGETPVSGMSRRLDAENMSDTDYYRLNTKF